MSSILFGIAGFITIHLFDLASLKGMHRAKPVIWAMGSTVLSYAAVKACLSTDKFRLPVWVSVGGWILLPVALAFMLYSLFGSLPFKRTYLQKGVGDQLIKTGLYGVVRHPGVYGFAAVMLSLFLLSTSKLMAIAAPIWLGTDVILVIFQDVAVFGRMFPGYADYRKETPMLIPTLQSLAGYAAEFKSKISTPGG